MTELRVTPAQRSADPEPAGGPDPVAAAWGEYLAAARQLDGVRRSAATIAGEQARSVQVAREELSVVRARLAHQRSRLRERGVPAMSLEPSPPEVAAAARSMVSGPAAVLAALRSAGGYADAAENALDARRLTRPAQWPTTLRKVLSLSRVRRLLTPPRLRNLLGSGSLAVLVPVLQVAVLGLTGTGGRGLFAALLGLPLAVGVCLLASRRPLRPGADGRRDGTSRSGALVCAIPTVLASAGILLLVLIR